MIVADTNLIAYRLIDGVDTELALAVWAKDAEWLVPPLWRHEFLSVLATQARHGNLTEKECLFIFERAVLLLQHGEHQPSLPEALSLALQTRVTPYDAQFVVLARRFGTPLVTSDRELLHKFPELAVSPRQFVGPTPDSVRESGVAYVARAPKRTRGARQEGCTAGAVRCANSRANAR